LVRADGGYARKLVAWVETHCRIAVHIVRNPEGQNGFAVLPYRRKIERTLSWMVRCRRLDHDYERLAAYSEAFIECAMIGLMTRRLAPTPGAPTMAIDQALPVTLRFSKGIYANLPP
jgi:hypothetical protein